MLPHNVAFALAVYVAESDATKKDALIEFIAALIQAYFYIEANPDLLLDGPNE